jgi:hypothetical protein
VTNISPGSGDSSKGFSLHVQPISPSKYKNDDIDAVIDEEEYYKQFLSPIKLAAPTYYPTKANN